MTCIMCGEYIPEGEGPVCVNCQKRTEEKLEEFRAAERRLNEALKDISVRPVVNCKHCYWYDEKTQFCTAGHIDGKIETPSADYCSRAILK